MSFCSTEHWAGSIFFAVLLLHASVASGLTIYRIGGESFPPPDLDTPYEFVQIGWSEIDAAQHGRENLIQFEPDSIRPQFLSPDINLTPLLRERGGEVLTFVWNGWRSHTESDELMFDGDLTTAFLGDGRFAVHWPYVKAMTFDLGAPLFLDRIRFFPRDKHLTDRFVQQFRIGINDGDPLKDGTREVNLGAVGFYFDFDIVYDETENTQSVIDLKFPDKPIRYVLFYSKENTTGIWEIAEFEIYGHGFAPFARYVSNVIDLGGPASLGSLRWSGDQDAGATLSLSTRSGLDADPNVYWRYTFRGGERTRFDAEGRPLTLASYGQLALGAQAGLSHDTAGWTFWSGAPDFATGAGVVAGAGARQFVQVRADFTSGQQTRGRLDWVELAVSLPPVAQQAIAEIVPSVVSPGMVSAFTYKVKASVGRADLGFDRLAIDTPARVSHVVGVRLSGQPVAFDVVARTDTGFVLAVPLVDAQRTEEVLEVDFHASVFQFGTVFSGRLFNSAHPAEVPQALAWGDADGEPSSERLQVDLTGLGGGSLGMLSVEPGVFSPNGDGVNDVVSIGCDVLNVSGGSLVGCWVYDLSGRRLVLVDASWLGSGRYGGVWDGRDGRGFLVPPGLYVVGLQVETDQGMTHRQALVAIAY